MSKKECQHQNPTVTVLYDGPACPYCLVLDDLDFTQQALRVATRAINVMTREEEAHADN